MCFKNYCWWKLWTTAIKPFSPIFTFWCTQYCLIVTERQTYGSLFHLDFDRFRLNLVILFYYSIITHCWNFEITHIEIAFLFIKLPLFKVISMKTTVLMHFLQRLTHDNLPTTIQNILLLQNFVPNWIAFGTTFLTITSRQAICVSNISQIGFNFTELP